ncbi:TIGR03619 family F420-dependent LLM class oxidoreductase [Jatrophihabitans sp.]|uniref:TIGR03619 family F420-dependent LLM class oxidoreductase n=1 Tax=Jatrophihabitans sp. TaxID=1932789 RepID=UPI002CA62A64|nr:TIGR03619 family F420-dependent LLM class oxidoreductase [Jatrophihabitans sp.]
MSRLRLGFGLPVSGSWARPANLVRIARRAEELGFESLWTFQRLLHPAEGDWGPMYRAVQDPIVTLAHVAAVTERARLGIAVVNAPFYSPVLLAKQLTTLDELSGGRLDVGLGLGWAEEEFAAVGVDPARRGARTEEFIACLKAIWTEQVVSFDGEFYRMPAVRVDPKPVQQPHPPLLLGGGAERALRRVGRIADGWISASRHDLRTVGTDLDVMRDAAREAGRDPDRLRFVVRGVLSLTEQPAGADRRPLHGDAGQIREDFDRLAEAGITELFIDLNFDPAVGSPDADPQDSMRRAEQLLQTFAPRS